MIKEKGMSPNCSMISSEKKIQTSKSSTSQQPPGQKVFTNCQPAFLKHIFRAGRSWGKGNPIPFFTCPQPEGKAPPPRGSPFTLRLRFTLHLYRFVDTPRLTDCDVDGGREGGPGWVFTREVFFWVGFLGISRCQVKLQNEKEIMLQNWGFRDSEPKWSEATAEKL